MVTPYLFIRLTHTGVHPDGRPNLGPVLVTDLDVGYEAQDRKVHVYVPVGGFIDIVASSRSMLAYQQGQIRKFVNAGVITAKLFFQPESYTTLNLPPASTYPKGAMVWNETEHAPNYAENGVWVSMLGGGPPAPHAPSHGTGGSDELVIDSTVAVNNSSATGLTVNSVTASNNAVTLTTSYTVDSLEADGTSKGTISQNAASAAPTGQPGVPRTIDVVFPVGWVGGTITVSGTGRNGAVITEVYTDPGGGGTAIGTKAFFSLTSFTNSAPSGPLLNATISLGEGYGVPNDNVVSFLKVSIDGNADTFSLADTANGTFDPTGAHHGNHSVMVWYTYTLSVTQASHTHGVTDPGHNHTQTGHSHTVS